jgi:hypothetical protein
MTAAVAAATAPEAPIQRGGVSKIDGNMERTRRRRKRRKTSFCK